MGRNYTTISLPVGLFNEVKKEVEVNDRYLNAADFIRQAIREKLESSFQYRKEKAEFENRAQYTPPGKFELDPGGKPVYHVNKD